MSKRIVQASIFLLSIPLFASLAAAADAPGGSYRQTCRNIVAGHNSVGAICKTEVWGEVNAFIDLKSCEPGFTGLTNRNGDLVCEGPYPPGSYVRSCRDSLVMNKTLSAVCEDKRGGWHHTSIPLAGCRVGFTNSDGRLLCGR
jgi:hypothetical protein